MSEVCGRTVAYPPRSTNQPPATIPAPRGEAKGPAAGKWIHRMDDAARICSVLHVYCSPKDAVALNVANVITQCDLPNRLRPPLVFLLCCGEPATV